MARASNKMGLDHNGSRRNWAIYNPPPPPILSDVAADDYSKAAKELFYTFYYYSPYKDYLSPLAGDSDFLAYHGSATDFHPLLQGFCSRETSTVDDLEQN